MPVEPPLRSAGSGETRRITSLQNDSIKAIRALEMRKERRETGLFIAEGASILITARDNGFAPATLVLGPDAETSPAAASLKSWTLERGGDCLEVSAPVLAKLAAKDNPQSLMGVFRQRWADAPVPGQLAAEALWLALEEVRDPGNLGTIIRTADAAGITGILLVGHTCDPYSREAVRASMGSIFALPVARMEHAAFIELARRWPADVVGTHLRGTLDFRAAGYAAPSLLVMGSEGAGLSDATAAACRKLVRIPMAGRLDSLNLAVATALMLYEMQRAKLRI